MSNITKIIFLILSIFNLLNIVINSKVAPNDTCRILALEGGGDKGAYQVGVINALIKNLNSTDVQWDVVSGISAGTLNGLGMALFPKGQEKEASDLLNEVWLGFTGKQDILSQKIPIPIIGPILGPVLGVFYGESLYNSNPLRKLLEKILKGKKIQRSYNIGATSIRTGEYLRLTDLTTKNIVEAALASSAVPGIFPPVHYGNDTFVDGGVSYFFDLTGAIQICKDKGFENEQIVMDLILCGYATLDVLPKKITTIDILMQTFDILMKNYKARDLLKAITVYPGVKFRYIVGPSEPISSGVPLNFEPKDIRHSIAVGEKDGKDMIKLGEGVIFNKLMKEYKAELQEKLRFLGDF